MALRGETANGERARGRGRLCPKHPNPEGDSPQRHRERKGQNGFEFGLGLMAAFYGAPRSNGERRTVNGEQRTVNGER